jgi:hypothetical protein
VLDRRQPIAVACLVVLGQAMHTSTKHSPQMTCLPEHVPRE